MSFFNNKVHVQINVDNYISPKESESESNSNNFELGILFSLFSLIFYRMFLKRKRELGKTIFELLILIPVLNVMKYFRGL